MRPSCNSSSRTSTQRGRLRRRSSRSKSRTGNPAPADHTPSRSPDRSCGPTVPLPALADKNPPPSGFSVDEGLERFDPIEDSFQLHPGMFSGGRSVTTPSITGGRPGCVCSFPSSLRYNACVGRNGVGLCWRATRQGIARSGRVNDPQAPATLQHAWAFFLSSPIHLPCPCLAKRTPLLLTSSDFTHEFCRRPHFPRLSPNAQRRGCRARGGGNLRGSRE